MAGDQPPSHRQDRELPGFATEWICRIWHGGCGVQKSRRGMTEALFCTGMPLFLQRQGCSGSSGGGGCVPPIWGFTWAVHPMALAVRSTSSTQPLPSKLCSKKCNSPGDPSDPPALFGHLGGAHRCRASLCPAVPASCQGMEEPRDGPC